MSAGWPRRARRLLAPGLWALGFAFILLGDAISGLALLTAGWFARLAVRAGDRRAALERLVAGVTVGEVMETATPAVAPQATLDTFAEDLVASEEATVARVIRDEQLVGLVGPRELARVPRRRWPEVHASEAMAPAEGLPVLAPGELLAPAAERLGELQAPGLPVVDDGRLAGILTRLAVGRTIHERAVAAVAGGAAGPAAPHEKDPGR